MQRSLAVTASALAIAAATAAAAATPPNMLVIGTDVGAIPTLDPAALNARTPSEVMANFYDNLVKLNWDDMVNVHPMLAESWDISPDGRKITFKLRQGAKFVSGNPITPLDRAQTLYDADSDGYRTTPGTVARNSDRLPAFHRLDLRLDKRWDFQDFSLTAYLEVINAYNHRSTEAFGYDYRYRSRTELQGLPILPIIGLKGEF